MLAGATVGFAALYPAVLLLPSGRQVRSAVWDTTRCVRYPLIRVEWICGKNVYWVNPDGSRVLMGKTRQLRPMPRARPVEVEGSK